MAAGPFEREIAQLSEKYARNPASRIFAPLADAYRRAGRLDEAMTVGQQGLRHHPEYVGGRMVLARTYFDRGELELATAEFRRVLDADPQNVVALRALGELAREQGDRLGAESWYRRAHDVDPSNLDVQDRLEELSAAPASHEAAGSADAPPGAAAALAPAESQRELQPEAASERPAAAYAPERAGAGEEIATVTLAEIYAEQGLHERALGIYRRILAEDPRNVPIRERAERLEARIAEERAHLDAEAGATLGGFVPGELQLTGDEVVTVDSAGGSVPPAPEMAAPEGSFAAAPPRRPTPEPWAFLLHDEADADPDEVFRTASRTAASATAGGGSPPEHRREPGAAGSTGEDEDLRKFQEWLRSLQ